MNRRRTFRSGVTVVELLIYIAMAAILLGAITTLQTVILQARQRMQTQIAVEEQGYTAMSTIARTIRNSSATVTPTTGATAASLSLSMPLAAVSPSLIDISANVLRLTEGLSAAQALTGGKVRATSFSAKNLTQPSAPSVVQVTLTLQATWGTSHTYTQIFTTSSVRRAYP